MDPDKASVSMRFAHDLRQLHLRAGRPSYSTLERVSKHQLRRATMSDILNGNRVNIPEWRFVAMFVEGCRAIAAENNLDIRELGSLADWKRHWDGANNGVIDARYPGSGQPLSARPDPGHETNGNFAERGTERADDGGTLDDPYAVAFRGSIPPRLTDFVGRQTWLADLRRLLVGSQGESGGHPRPVRGRENATRG